MRRSTGLIRVLALAVSLAALAACNPLEVHTRAYPGGGIEEAAVRYRGPAGSWVELSVTGAEGHVVFALALVRDEDRTGPVARPCATQTGTTDCVDTASDVRMPGQVVAPADGGYAPLITAWSGEIVDVWLVCVDEATQDLSCPTGMRTTLRAVDDAGARTGDLTDAIDDVPAPG